MGAPLALLASMATGLIPKIAPIAARAGSGLLTRAAAAARPVVSQTAQAVRNEGLGDLAARAGRKVNQYLSPGSGSEYGIRPVETGKYTPSASGEYGIRPAEGRETGFRSFAQPSQQPRSQAPSEPNAPAKNDRSTFQRLANLVQQSLRQRSQGVATAADGAPASPLTDVQRAERRAGYKEQYGDIVGGGMADEADAADADRARKKQDAAVEQNTERLLKLAGAAGTTASGLLSAYVGVKYFAEAQAEAQESLRRYSGQINRAYAELDVGRLRRQYDTANSTGMTTKLLAQSVNKLEQNLQPIRDGIINCVNLLAAISAIAAAQAPAVVENLAKSNKYTYLGYLAITQLNELMKDDQKPAPNVWNQALQDIANGRFNTIKWGANPGNPVNLRPQGGRGKGN